MAAKVYDLNDLAGVEGTFKDKDSELADPEVVFLQVMTPEGEKTTYQYGVDENIVRESIGVYYSEIDLNVSGDWYYRWYSTTTVQAATADIRLRVGKSKFE